MIRRDGPVVPMRRALRSVRARLSNERGDTLVEALAALLIAALGAALLATMVMVSTNVVAQTRSVQTANFKAESQVYDITGETSTEVISTGVDMSISAGGVTQDVPVTKYTSADGTYTRYVGAGGN